MSNTKHTGAQDDGTWVPMRVDFYFQDVYEVQERWSDHTFGNPTERDHRGPLDHLRKEIAEAEANPEDVSEFADLLLLTFDAARRAGHNYRALLKATVEKLNINQRRQWGPTGDPTKAVEHVRTETEKNGE